MSIGPSHVGPHELHNIIANRRSHEATIKPNQQRNENKARETID